MNGMPEPFDVNPGPWPRPPVLKLFPLMKQPSIKSQESLDRHLLIREQMGTEPAGASGINHVRTRELTEADRSMCSAESACFCPTERSRSMHRRCDDFVDRHHTRVDPPR